MNLSLSTGVENDAIDEDNTLSHLVQIWFSHEPILIWLPWEIWSQMINPFPKYKSWGSLTKIVTEGVRNLSGWLWKPNNSLRGVCHVLQSHLGQGTLVTTFKLLKWNVHHVRVDQTFKCPVRTTILTKFLKRRHDLDWRHYKTNCLNGMRFSEYRHWISLGALKKQIGSGWLVFLP